MDHHDKFIEEYIKNKVRENTRKSYEKAVYHFQIQWKGCLPATEESISKYLIDYAKILLISTLTHRLEAIAYWHIDHGYPDPTQSPIIYDVLKEIKKSAS